jgi:UDP-N-acetylglucosamine 2-epimerase (non-hydrolysing)
MKVMTVLGTRPEIIRLSLIIKLLDKYCDHVLVHTGQNGSDSLNKIFFDELGIRQPNYAASLKSWHVNEQIPEILLNTAEVMLKEKPDKVLILGDTNSGLSAIVAARLGIPVYHMESGNRCFLPIPEEINRKIIDAISTYLLPYTDDSRENLLVEGVHKSRIFLTGNPIFEVLRTYEHRIEGSDILKKLELLRGEYFLVTAHRSENVDDRERLQSILESLHRLAQKYGLPVICSLHPRTKSKMETFGLSYWNPLIKMEEPFGFFDFAKLESNAKCILTDSGTVQEEAGYFGVPTVTLRDATERPDTINSGSNMLAGVTTDSILKCVDVMCSCQNIWQKPEINHEQVASRTVKFILSGYNKAGETVDPKLNRSK